MNYLVRVPAGNEAGYAEFLIATDVAPAIVDGQGLTLILNGAAQAPSPFAVWQACDLVPE